MKTFIFTFVRPILEYGIVVWNNCSQYRKYELENIQTQATRIAIEATKFASINILHNETQWETLQQRRQNHQHTLFYKMSEYLTPHYLSSFPQPVVLSHVITYSIDLQTDTGSKN